MDEKIRNLWKNVIPQQQLESNETQATYKSLSLADNITILNDEEMATVIENNKQRQTPSGDASTASTIIENNTTQVPVNLHKSHHVILNEIARGGMGAIYHGNQMCLNRDVAIKKMLATNEETSSRFISEALVTAFLDHPNIVPIYELSKNESEEIILAMKLVGGNTWSEILESKDFSDHVEILLSVCNAIAYAHSKGIIHCDLKPANIMIGEFGEVLVMDWGIAVDISPNEVKRGIPQKEVQRPMGTPCYMPAELAEGRGEHIGPWTDVYLLGGILYRLLTGNPPHTGQTILEVLRSACNGSELNFCDDTPLEIQEICRKALAFSPTDRYQTALEFSNDLRNFTKHRESIIISNQANAKLTQCIANGTTKNIYEELTTCISGFQQAIELWADNLHAKTRLYDARIFYAQTALENGDLGLAQVQTQKIQDSEQKQRLLAQVNRALHEKKSTQYRARMMKYALIVSVITIVVIGITSYLKIVYEKSVAVKNAQIAEEQKYIAETQRESAERLRREKERDATNIRGHMAQISLHKASDIAQKSPLHDRQYSQIATYAGAAAKFIKNIDMNIAQQLRIPIHNIKQQVKSKISTALREHSLLWTTLGTHNIFHHKGARICWSSDGNLLATAYTHNIILWNMQGQNLRTWTTTDEVSAICFSQNNKHICAAVNKNIKIFDLHTTQRHTLSGHDAPITALKIYNESLVSACTNGEIHLWDLATGKNIQTIKYSQPITTIAPCSATQKIAFTTQDNIGLIDVTQRSIIKVIGIDSAPITSLAFSPSGDFIACATHDNVIKICDGNLQGIHTSFAGHSAKINRLLFKSDQELLSVSDDNSIKIWNLTTKEHISIAHTRPVKEIAATRDLLCTMDDNGYATLWKNNHKVNSFPGHRDTPHNLIFRQNLLFVHNNKQINIYDEYSGQKIYELNTPVYGIDVNMEGSLLAIATEKEVDLWDTAHKRYVGKLHIGQHFDHKLIKFRPQHHAIAICVNNDIQLWNLQTQKMYAVIERTQGTASINFSNDGQKLITTSQGLTVQIWDIHEARTTYNYTTKNSDGSLCLYEFDSEDRTDYATFNATGNFIALSTDFGQIHVYQYIDNRWKMYTKIINNAQPYAIPVFHPQRNNVICANNSKGVYIFRLQANSPQIMQFIELSDAQYYCLAQHGNTLATATQTNVKLWQVKNSDEEFSGRGVTTSSDGRFIAWIQGVRSIVVYDTKTHKKWQVPEKHLESITKLTFHPQSNILASADGENIIFLNKITDTKIEVKDTNMIGYHLTFSKDGSKAVTLNMREELVHIWDAQNAQSLWDIEHDDFAYHAIFSDNGTLLATDNGSNIFIWDVDSGKLLATLAATAKDLVSFSGTTITYKNFQDELVDCDIETAKSTPRAEKMVFAYKENIISLDNEVLYINTQGKKHAIKKISGKIEYLCFAEQFIVVQKNLRIELIHLNKTKQVVFANNTSSGFVWNPDKQKWIFHVDEKNLLHAMEGFFAQKMMPSLSLRTFSPPLYLWNSEE